LTIYLFGIGPSEANTYLAEANTAECSWPGCTNAPIIGATFKAPHTATGAGIAHSCACVDHRPDLFADTLDSWAQTSTTSQTID